MKATTIVLGQLAMTLAQEQINNSDAKANLDVNQLTKEYTGKTVEQVATLMWPEEPQIELDFILQNFDQE